MATLNAALAKRADELGQEWLKLANLIEKYAHESFVPGDEYGFNNPSDMKEIDGKRLFEADDRPDLGFGVPLVLPDRETARNLLEVLEPVRSSEGGQIISCELTPMTAELAPEGQHWCAGRGQGYSFGNRAAARRLIGADRLKAKGLRGKGVHVFVVDQGLNQSYIERLGGNFATGVPWETDNKVKVPGEEKAPYLPVERGHGGMLVRSLIDLAPESKIYDFPLIPRRITGSDFFGLNATYAFWIIRLLCDTLAGPWVILNAWGLVDRFAETVRGGYSNNRNHWLNILIASIGTRHDVIFAAGNNGQFCGDPRATGYDLGPGRSIFGANGLPEVYSAGAVRTDGTWVGAASQGPGPSGFAVSTGIPVQKPDLAAPSWFNEDRDAALRSGGTSSAAAVLAGVVAALRSHPELGSMTPAALRQHLRGNSRPTNGPGWSRRTGTGIVNLTDVL
ncbi:S8 family serine peptidase [Sedimentitalea sp. JM2-8]|uniref:S8 family serine peptidase n=2 Tax=Sedimentitalea xiamensis TaxID=3050037 RepID=A0ABT7FJR5_9RHOB|nr:S8 family serine peptidase [Sedimentitalea xiamensis]